MSAHTGACLAHATALLALIGSVLLSCVQTARAQRVVVQSPSWQDAELADAYHRLEAELHLHGFESVPSLLAPSRDSGDTALELLAADPSALAAVVLSQTDGTLTMEVGLRDRSSGETRLRALQAEPGSEAPNLIAVRAVDLLRASRGDYTQTPKPTPSPSQRAQASTEPDEPEAAPPARPQLWLLAEGLLVRPGPDFALAYGPALGLAYALSDLRRFELALMLAGPLGSSRLHTDNGSALVRQELAWLELRWTPLRAGPVRAGLALGGGAYFLQAEGRAVPQPLQSRNAQVWSAMAHLGARLELALSAHVALALSLRARALIPRLGVQVFRQSATLDLPVLEASFGLALGL